MTEKGHEDQAGGGGAKPPTPGRAIRLKTMDDVRMEMARVYTDARRGNVLPEAGSKLIYMLSQVKQVIEGTDLRRELEALKDAITGVHR